MRTRIKVLLLLLMVFIVCAFPSIAFASFEMVSLNMANIDKGIVQIACRNESEKNIKVMIEKGTDRYTYDLKSDGTAERFPLQMGNGAYKISVLINIDGNRYSYLKTESVLLDLEDAISLYLNSIQNIKWSDDGPVTNEAVKITEELDSDQAKIKEIYKYIVENFRYDYNKIEDLQPQYIPNIRDTLNTKKGICYDYASLFASMVRSIGIPCKLVKGYAENVFGYHAWNEVMINGKWLVIDTSTDIQLRKAKAVFKMEKDAAKYTKVYEY